VIFLCLFTFHSTPGTDKHASFEIMVSLDFSINSGFIITVSLANSGHFLVSFREVTTIILMSFHIWGAASHTQSFSYIKVNISSAKSIKSCVIFVMGSLFVLKYLLSFQVSIV
jgi:hypothetical protein